MIIAGTTLIKATAGFIIAASSALGEEIGWRGYLAPRLARGLGAQHGALLLGGLWALWHVPLFLAGGYNNGTAWWFGLVCFAVLVFACSIISMWLRLASGSVWPCVAWHASHNLFIQNVFGSLTGQHGEITPYMAGEFGLMTPLIMFLIALPLYRRLGKLGAGDASSYASRRPETTVP